LDWVSLYEVLGMEIKHVCQSCGEIMAVHEHESWQEVKDCLTGLRALCRECASWPGCPSAGVDEHKKPMLRPPVFREPARA